MTKIRYVSDNKNGVINNLNTCISNINSVNNVLYNTYAPSGFYYRNTFNNMKNNLVSTKNKLVNYKNNINNYMENLNKDELELSSKINRIENVFVDKF